MQDTGVGSESAGNSICHKAPACGQETESVIRVANKPLDGCSQVRI